MALAEAAQREGYNVLIINPCAPPLGFDEEKEIELMDFSNNVYVEQAIDVMRE